MSQELFAPKSDKGIESGLSARHARTRNCLRLTAVAAGLLALSSNASALLDDKLQVFASETVTRDDNIFRLSDSDPRLIAGTTERSDTYKTTTVGFSADVPVSRQRFQAGLSWNKNTYNRFSDLDNTGRNGMARWLWQVGNNWSGQLGYNESAALTSFSDFLVGVPIVDRLTVKRGYFDAGYMVTPSWQVQLGLADETRRNSETLRQVNDVDLQDRGVTVNYIAPDANKIGINVQQQDGSFPNREPVAGLFVDNRYVQRSVGVVTDWTITGKSHLAARIDRVNRDYDEFSQRNFEGTTYRALYDWKATGKFTLSALAHREISTNEASQTSFVLVRGVALRPSLEVTDKIKVAAIADYSVREYLGDAGFVLGTLRGETDRVHTYGATVSYQVLRTLSLLFSGQHQTRSSNVPLGDYKDNVYSITARLAF